MAAKLDNKEKPLIPEFYAGREVLITGATGFMGKVLIERLLSTCPDIGRLHLLVRVWKNDPETRLNQLKESKLFDALSRNNPEQLNKLHVIPGDITKPNLGMSKESIAELQNVSLVFHLAATVNMDQDLDMALRVNTFAPGALLDICDGLPKLAAYIHVSTAYCHCDRTLVEERVYPLPRPLDQILQECCNARSLTREQLNRLISPKPNTYIFTKTLAEALVKEHGCRTYPIAIFRPTIVVSSVRDPFPGWIQGYSGPIGVATISAKGLLHAISGQENNCVDFLPVDIGINSLIAVGWETAIDKPPEIRVYNCSTGANPTTWGEIRRCFLEEMREQPSSTGVFWYPFFVLVECRYALMFLMFFLEIIPMYVIELFLKVFSKDNKRINYISTSTRMWRLRFIMYPFTVLKISFVTDNVRKLEARLSKPDAALYNFDPSIIEWNKYYKNMIRGVNKYLLKDEEAGSPAAKKRMQRFYYIHCCVSIIALLLVAWVLKNILLGAAAVFARQLSGILGEFSTELVLLFDNL